VRTTSVILKTVSIVKKKKEFGGVPNLPIFEISRKITPLYLLTQTTKLGAEVMDIRIVMS
jgi:hypothetical protein